MTTKQEVMFRKSRHVHEWVMAYISSSLLLADGDVAKAAKQADIDKTSFIAFMKRYGIKATSVKKHNEV